MSTPTPPSDDRGSCPSEQLVALVEGRLGLDELRQVVGHARRCQTCQADLVEVAAGAGALRAAVAPSAADGVALPPAAFLDDIAAAGGHQPPAAGEALGTGAAVVPFTRRHRRGVLAVAAAVAVIGLTVGIVAARGGAPRGATVALAPIATTAPAGSIRMDGSGRDRTMTVSTELPPARAGTYYEVWLLTVRDGAMVPVGVLPASGQARYVLPAALVARYDAVDISLQPDNGSTRHSNDSVLRAVYS